MLQQKKEPKRYVKHVATFRQDQMLKVVSNISFTYPYTKVSSFLTSVKSVLTLTQVWLPSLQARLVTVKLPCTIHMARSLHRLQLITLRLVHYHPPQIIIRLMLCHDVCQPIEPTECGYKFKLRNCERFVQIIWTNWRDCWNWQHELPVINL